MSETVIEVLGLKKTYRAGLFRRRQVEALKGVSFKVQRGEIFGLLGPNGAGKTTMVKVLLGLVHKTGGSATVLGHSAGAIAARKRVGYLPEHHRIPRHHTVNSALEYYGSLSHMSGAQIREKRQPMLDLVGLGDWGAAGVKTLSKGMQQRLGLAQAMLHEPDLLILDEPTDGVDPVGRAEMREVLKKLAGQGTTIFINSHLLQEIELVCSQIAILEKGTLRWHGSVADFTGRKSTEEVTLELIGEKPKIMMAAGHDKELKLTDAPQGRARLVIKLSDQQALDELVDRLRANGISIAMINKQRQTLEEAFLGLLKE